MKPMIYLSAFLFLISCSPYKTLVVKKDLEATYAAAVVDAATAQPTEIYKSLNSLNDENPSLVKNDKGQILVVTTTNWNGYDNKVGQPMDLTRKIWVTAVPELKDFCNNLKLDSAKMFLRLEQLLGLPPNNGKDRFVEIWVNPDDIFRPCPDPEINDEACELSYPKSPYTHIDEAHKQWIEELTKASYGKDGYPWTRLGYTYDWGNPKTPVGLSEYVIKEGAKVMIKSVSNVYDYCGAKR